MALWIAFVATSLPVFAVAADTNFALESRVAAWLLTALGTAPLAHYLHNPRRFPLLALVSLGYVVTFALPVFAPPSLSLVSGVVIPGEVALLEAFQCATMALLATCGGALVAGRILERRLSRPVSIQIAYPESLYLGVCLVVGWRVLLLFPGRIPGGLQQPLLVLLDGQLGVALIAIGFYARVLRRSHRLLAIPILVLTIAAGLYDGLLGNALFPVIIIGVSSLALGRKTPVAWGMCFFVIFFLIQPIKARYREIVWYRGSSSTVEDRVRLYGQLLREYWLTSAPRREDVVGSVQQSTSSRISNLALVAHILQSTPERVPYLGGSSFKYMLVAWVPRALWPGKPIAQQENIEFAVNYGLLRRSRTQRTMYGVTHLGDVLANFGPLGVTPVFLLIGAAMAVAARKLAYPESGLGGLAMLVTLSVSFVNMGSTLSHTFGNLLQQIVVQVILLRIFAVRRRRARIVPGFGAGPTSMFPAMVPAGSIGHRRASRDA